MKVMYSIKNNETIATIQPDQNDFIEEIKNIEKKCCNSKEFFSPSISLVLESLKNEQSKLISALLYLLS